MTEQRYTELGQIQSPLGGDHAAEGKGVPADSTLERVRHWILYRTPDEPVGQGRCPGRSWTCLRG
jgi:hypothetical protein